MKKMDIFEHEARTLAGAYQKRVGELLSAGYQNPDDRKRAAQEFAIAIGAMDAPAPLTPVSDPEAARTSRTSPSAPSVPSA